MLWPDDACNESPRGPVLTPTPPGGGQVRAVKAGQERGARPATEVQSAVQVRRVLSEPAVLDTATAAMIRSHALHHFELRACVIAVAWRYQWLQDANALPPAVQSSIGLEVLELHAPLARTLGLGAIADELELLAFQVPSAFRSVPEVFT